MTTSLSREGVVADEGGVQKLNRYQIAREVILEYNRFWEGEPPFPTSDILDWLDQQQTEPRNIKQGREQMIFEMGVKHGKQQAE